MQVRRLPPLLTHCSVLVLGLPLLPSALPKRALPLLEDVSGAVAADPLAARRIWQSHFSQLDLGNCVSLHQHDKGVIAAQTAASFPLPGSVDTGLQAQLP